MAAPSTGSDNILGRTSWSLQHRRQSTLPQHTPSAQSAQLMNSTGFKGWTDTPPVGVPDPYIADQTRQQRRYLTGPTSSHAPEPFAGGRRVVGLVQSAGLPEGKRAFPDAQKLSTDERKPEGLRRVDSRARKNEPATSDPNTAVATLFTKPESVKMFHGTNQVNYHCWVPAELRNAEKGDWNWNNSLGFRKVSTNALGQPKRGLENPVAWPTFAGYPPTNDAATGQPIDYALKLNGRQGGFTLKVQHPDVAESRANRAAASNTRLDVSSQPVYYRRGAY